MKWFYWKKKCEVALNRNSNYLCLFITLACFEYLSILCYQIMFSPPILRHEIPVEKVVISQDCELVTLMTRVKGRLEVTSRIFSFIDLDQSNEEGEHYDFK